MSWITGWFVSIFVAIYLFVDAPKHGKNKWLWSILGLLFGLFTLGIYLIQTGRKGLGWTVLIVSILIYSIFILVYVFYFILLIIGYSNA
ncbi:hypothetical protein BK049_02820 [Bacillus xiamenensis]|uniref:Uncharacterized protein n=1 Tax=Bacillus xiamenensis TaxID=1178537 RepID=A0AAC9NBE1_9BACI|nr:MULTISPECIES: hypothetical protein [Bacillus]AOZ87730.1 hypothetical protein BK049_02820 [Bacillus xiamenensis]MBG9913010.1 membrane protein [Bacillus xiamenensis]MCW1836752.1 hypothetical protein [Bacillus xiamenensis]MCY9577315.1 hypothetical protein [Bacillus xiamenensis]QGX66584.1 hypothetical protein GPA07_14410 [Bacillus sp. ms-22]